MSGTKYVILLGDGMAGWPLEELDGLTCLRRAGTPNMDRLAASAESYGGARTVPEGFPAGSDVANLGIFGYDPKSYYTGRAPLEAGAMGVELRPGDIAFRCNLVTLKLGSTYAASVMEDYSAGHVTTEEARELVALLAEAWKAEALSLYPGVSYRHLMVQQHGEKAETVPPHDILGEVVGKHLPKGDGADRLLACMERSVTLFESAPVNRRRRDAGRAPANSIWLWGQGRRPEMPLFRDLYGKTGAIVSAVDLTKGIGVFAGFEVIEVPGATGYLDTNYDGKVEATLDALDRHDLVYLHVEAPDEAGHGGKIEDKIRAIEDFDRRIVGPVLAGLAKRGPHRVLLMPDHPTPIAIRTHSADPVPWIVYDSRKNAASGGRRFDEGLVTAGGGRFVDAAHRLMPALLGVEAPGS